ncbi:hypothetical protein Tco_1346809 [Tanacetum coccineum]
MLTPLIILLYDSEDEFEHPSHTVETPTSPCDPSPRNMPINSNTTLTRHLAMAIYETKIRVAHDSMDRVIRQGAKVEKNANKKRRWGTNQRSNHVQQPPMRQNMARAYTAGSNEKSGYAGKAPFCNKCKLHHVGPCTMKCGNCKRISHMTRDCRTPIPATTQRALVANQKAVVTCYEC